MTVSIVLARAGGLWAEYFNNAFLNGEPAMSRVDNRLDFTWNGDLVTKEASDFTSIHWYGKLLAPASEDFTIIMNGDDGFRFYIDHVLLIDRWETCCDEMMFTMTFVQGQFYDIRVEFKEMQEIAYFSVEWSSPSILR